MRLMLMGEIDLTAFDKWFLRSIGISPEPQEEEEEDPFGDLQAFIRIRSEEKNDPHDR